MHILIVNNTQIPVHRYGGTERVIWYLGKELAAAGHRVSYLVRPGSSCPFADVLFIDDTKDVVEQIPQDVDVVHFHFTPNNIQILQKPYLVTIHGNSNDQNPLNINAVFVSQNHAARYGSHSFVYNGLDWRDYSKPDISAPRAYFHFLGNAAWRVKNVQGAIDIIRKTQSETLIVLGGVRFNFSQGLRFTFSPRVRFRGMVGGAEKDRLLQHSKGLIFPVRWHEPFGLAVIESFYFGCPVFGTPYGSLPELVRRDVGYLSGKKNELAAAVENAGSFSHKICHEYARDTFNSRNMMLAYLEKYETVLSGKTLNESPPRLQKIQSTKFLPWE